ncbi:MAG TPA: ABC transporter substrate-binding protein [Armatimonadota bacterium]|nr:ABC transporter substrate-binding protein [Armatimonadota bacterium]
MGRNKIRAFLLAIIVLGTLGFLIFIPRFSTGHSGRSHQVQVVGNQVFPMTVTDSTGRDVVIHKKPARIISLAPGVTEILFAIGAGKQVIADSTFCDFPEQAKRLPKIGGYLDPNIEKITSLNSDLIIGERGNRRDILDQLSSSLGFTVLAVDPTSLRDISQSIQLIGEVTGNSLGAQRLYDDFDRRSALVQSRLAKIPSTALPRTLFLFSLDGGIYTVGPGSHIDELIKLAGGKNIAAPTGKPWPQLSMEMVAKSDPEVILLINEHGGKSGNLTSESALRQLRTDANWRKITAVKTGRVVVLDDDLITIPGPRLIDGLEQMATALHPDVFPGKRHE